jgi:hypothetical protein
MKGINRIMTPAEKYRLGAVISIALLLLSLVMLFVALWNNISLQPEITVSNWIYFLIILAAILGTGLFLLFMWYANTLKYSEPVKEPDTVEQEKATEENKTGEFAAPYEVDIDVITASIFDNISPSLSIREYTERILINLAKEFEITQGIFYLLEEKSSLLKPVSVYAYASDKEPEPFSVGEGLVGQTAKSKQILLIEHLPGNYLNVASGLGEHKANQLVIIPLLVNKNTLGIIEFTTFRTVDEKKLWIFRNLAKVMANALINKIKSGDTKG